MNSLENIEAHSFDSNIVTYQCVSKFLSHSTLVKELGHSHRFRNLESLKLLKEAVFLFLYIFF